MGIVEGGNYMFLKMSKYKMKINEHFAHEITEKDIPLDKAIMETGDYILKECAITEQELLWYHRLEKDLEDLGNDMKRNVHKDVRKADKGIYKVDYGCQVTSACRIGQEMLTIASIGYLAVPVFNKKYGWHDGTLMDIVQEALNYREESLEDAMKRLKCEITIDENLMNILMNESESMARECRTGQREISNIRKSYLSKKHLNSIYKKLDI